MPITTEPLHITLARRVQELLKFGLALLNQVECITGRLEMLLALYPGIDARQIPSPPLQGGSILRLSRLDVVVDAGRRVSCVLQRQRVTVDRLKPLQTVCEPGTAFANRYVFKRVVHRCIPSHPTVDEAMSVTGVDWRHFVRPPGHHLRKRIPGARITLSTSARHGG